MTRLDRLVRRWLLPLTLVGPTLWIIITLVLGAVHPSAAQSQSAFLDFHTFLVGGHDFLHQHSPYPAPRVLDGYSLANQERFVYPPHMAAFFAPLAALPYTVAAALWVSILVAATPAALFLLGVRDWRCFCVALDLPPVLTATSVGAVSPLLLLGTAAAWRFRRKAWLCGVAVAAVVLAKLFLWPLLVWLAVTGRRRALAWASAAGAAAVTAAWSWIGFQGLHDYPHVLSRLGSIEGPYGYQPAWILGASTPYVLAAAALVLAGGYMLLGRRVRDERTLLTLALILALATSPIVWLHYFVLLLVPLALLDPMISFAWLAPFALFATIGATATVRVSVAAAVTFTVVLSLVRRERRGAETGRVTAAAVPTT